MDLLGSFLIFLFCSGLRDQCWFCCLICSCLLLPTSPPSGGAASSPSSLSSALHLPFGVFILPSVLSFCSLFHRYGSVSWSVNTRKTGLFRFLIWCSCFSQELRLPEALCKVWWQEPDVLWEWKGAKIFTWFHNTMHVGPWNCWSGLIAVTCCFRMPTLKEWSHWLPSKWPDQPKTINLKLWQVNGSLFSGLIMKVPLRLTRSSLCFSVDDVIKIWQH